MRVDIVQMEIAARRQRAQAIAELLATAITWIVSHAPRLRHAARPHFAR
jgi:hypothetical protein